MTLWFAKYGITVGIFDVLLFRMVFSWLSLGLLNMFLPIPFHILQKLKSVSSANASQKLDYVLTILIAVHISQQLCVYRAQFMHERG